MQWWWQVYCLQLSDKLEPLPDQTLYEVNVTVIVSYSLQFIIECAVFDLMKHVLFILLMTLNCLNYLHSDYITHDEVMSW